MNKTYIFDFFGVICSEIAPVWLRNTLPDHDARKIHDELIAPVDEGKASEDRLFALLGTFAKSSSHQVEEEWRELVHIDKEVVELIKNLKQTSSIGLCSNAWSSFIRPILEKENLTELFQTIVISSEVGKMKPDPEIFLRTCKDLGVEPNECIFIDDQSKNTTAASALGMESILFTSADALKKQLAV